MSIRTAEAVRIDVAYRERLNTIFTDLAEDRLQGEEAQAGLVLRLFH